MTESYVTVATDDISCLGCLVLCNSLKQSWSEKLISVIVYPNVSYHLKNVLQKSFDRLYFLSDLHANTDNLNQHNIHGEYEKLKCWLLTDFSKCVFLESDVLVVENIDDLFNRIELSATSDPRWPDCFDAGVFVFQPSLKTYNDLVDYSITNQSAGNSFQSLLNMFFCNWNSISLDRKIPFTYNCQMNLTFYTHTPAIVHFGHSIKAARLGDSVFHLMQPDPSLGGVADHDNWSRLWSKWWKIFNEMVKPAIDSDDKFNFKRTGVDYGEQDETFRREGATFPYYEQTQPSQQSTFPSQGSACSVQESLCPSQDFTLPCETVADYHEPIVEIETHMQPQGDSIDDIPVESVLGSEGKDTEITEKDTTPCDMEKDHRLRWERGEIDYMGADRFANILVQLNSSLMSSNDEDSIVNLEE